MTENTTEKAAPKPRKPRATKKVAESAPVENVVVEETVEAPVEDNVVSAVSVKPSGKRSSGTHAKENGTVSSLAADVALAKPETVEAAEDSVEDDKVAVWSEKNIRWSQVGTLVKGYNIISKEAADKWLQRVDIRLATPEEIATYYGN